jgi:hypothetical protein
MKILSVLTSLASNYAIGSVSLVELLKISVICLIDLGIYLKQLDEQ